MFWQSRRVLFELWSLLQARCSLSPMLLLWPGKSTLVWTTPLHFYTCNHSIADHLCVCVFLLPIESKHFIVQQKHSTAVTPTTVLEMREWWLFSLQRTVAWMLLGGIRRPSLQRRSSLGRKHSWLQLVPPNRMWCHRGRDSGPIHGSLSVWMKKKRNLRVETEKN